MQIDKKLILKLENLARLELSKNEREELTGDLNNILNMVDKLNEVDTTGVEPLTHFGEAQNVFRKDEIKGEVSQVEAFKNAPKSDGEFFQVPKVINKK